MFLTLDRIENETVAVLIDDSGNKYDVHISLIPKNYEIGNVYTIKDGMYIYNEKETKIRHKNNSEKLKKLFNKAIDK